MVGVSLFLTRSADDVVLLVAAYPTLESGAWIDDSGAALLLEFARVMGSPRPAYTLVLALAETRPASISQPDGESRADSGWQPVTTPAVARGLLADAGSLRDHRRHRSD